MDQPITLFNDTFESAIKQVPDRSINLVLADPPYGVTGRPWDEVIDFNLMWTELRRVLADAGPIILFGSQPFTSKLVMSNLRDFKYEIIWDKHLAGNALNSNYQPLKIHENILLFSPGPGSGTYNPIYRIGVFRYTKPRAKVMDSTFGRQEIKSSGEKTNLRKPVSILSYYLSRTGRSHPTEKPVELLEYLIRTYSNPGDTVLDFCMGSGSTGEAAIHTGRRFVGMEPDRFYSGAEKRIRSAGLQPSLIDHPGPRTSKIKQSKLIE